MDRERSRLAVLRELEDAGPAKCVELMGEVESLRLGLAHKHHELEEEQQRAQMYAEDVVEAQAKAAEEEARAETAEEKLEAAALVEEENEILREALHSMDDGARQAQRGLNRIHDEAIGAEQAMQDKLIAVLDIFDGLATLVKICGAAIPKDSDTESFIDKLKEIPNLHFFKPSEPAAGGA